MKIIAHGTVASGSPYVHLGYTSAAPRAPEISLLSALVILLGIAMAYSVAAGKTPRGFTTFNLKRRPSMVLVLGGYSVILAGFIALVWSFGSQPTSPGSRAQANLRVIVSAASMYDAQWNAPLPSHLADLTSDDSLLRFVIDPRLHGATSKLTPESDPKTRAAQVDARCDFFYAGAGVPMGRVESPSRFIVLYDHPNAGPYRILALADGHVETLAAGSSEIETLVEANNQQRKALKLPLLPAGLSGPPFAVP
jgi:hypothetical protein